VAADAAGQHPAMAVAVPGVASFLGGEPLMLRRATVA